MVKLITNKCVGCGKQSEVEITQEQYDMLHDPKRPLIQNIFPEWSAPQRELLITGTHPKCWDEMFAGDEYD